MLDRQRIIQSFECQIHHASQYKLGVQENIFRSPSALLFASKVSEAISHLVVMLYN